MPLQKTEIIILRRWQVREGSLLLAAISPEIGKITLTARSALRPGSGLAEALQYFVVAQISIYLHEKKSIDHISRAEVSESFTNIHADQLRYGHAAAGLELVNLFMHDGEVDRNIYYLLKKYLRRMNSESCVVFIDELLHFWYLLTIFAGYSPELATCCQCGNEIMATRILFYPEAGGVLCRNCVSPEQRAISLEQGIVKALLKLADIDMNETRKVRLSNSQRMQMRNLLTTLTEYQVGKDSNLKSFDFLRKLNIYGMDGGVSGKEN